MKRYKKALISLYARVHELAEDRVQKGHLVFEVQEELLLRIVQAETRIRKARSLAQHLKRILANRENTRAISDEIRKKHQAALDASETQKTLIRTLRTIGDSIAFIYGDRHELKQLVRNGDPGFISGKKGTRLERRIFRAAADWGATIVMNDLTNTLRHADFTLFRPDLWPEGGSLFFLAEAKSGKGGNKKRAERQLKAAEAIHKYIKTDKAEDESGSRVRIAVRDEISHHGQVMTRLAQKLPRQGVIVEEVEPGLHYLLIDGAFDTRDLYNVLSPFNSQGKMMALLSVNDQKKVDEGYYPFPLLIRDPEVLFRFYNGEFVANVVVDVSYINDCIRSHDIAIEFSADTWKIVSLTHGADDWGERYLSNRAIHLLAAEFISLQWFIDNILTGPLLESMTEFIAKQKCKTCG